MAAENGVSDSGASWFSLGVWDVEGKSTCGCKGWRDGDRRLCLANNTAAKRCSNTVPEVISEHTIHSEQSHSQSFPPLKEIATDCSLHPRHQSIVFPNGDLGQPNPRQIVQNPFYQFYRLGNLHTESVILLTPSEHPQELICQDRGHDRCVHTECAYLMDNRRVTGGQVRMPASRVPTGSNGKPNKIRPFAVRGFCSVAASHCFVVQSSIHSILVVHPIALDPSSLQLPCSSPARKERWNH